VRLAHFLNYTIEEVLDHDILWVNKMQEIVAREELEKNLIQLAMHGIPQDKIEEIRNNFEKQFKDEKELKVDSKMELLKLQGISGFKVGRKNKTRFIR